MCTPQESVTVLWLTMCACAKVPPTEAIHSFAGQEEEHQYRERERGGREADKT